MYYLKELLFDGKTRTHAGNFHLEHIEFNVIIALVDISSAFLSTSLHSY
jgi:hypothetical protein